MPDEAIRVEEEGRSQRQLQGATLKIITAVAVLAALYHLYLARFGILEALQMRSLHLAWLLPMAFILYPASRRAPRSHPTTLDTLLALLAVASTTYVGIWEYGRLTERWVGVDPVTPLDYAGGLGLVLLVLEAGRRTMGWTITSVLLICLAYLFLGQYLPWSVAHSGFTFQRILEQLYLTPEGIFGIPVGASATFVILYVIFAAFLERSGVGQFFMDVGSVLVGGARGGPAKIAVVVSAFEGMITGSAVANTVGSGAVTIPMMKRLGYKAHFAAAVEASASSGGQIMPPVMGVAAFVMAEFLGMSYARVALAAAIPAILYFVAVGYMVHFEALKLGLRGLPKEELPNLRKTLRRGWHLPFPIFILIGLLIAGFSAFLTAFWAILAVIAVSWIRRETRMGLRAILAALAAGATGTVLIAAATSTAGIIVGTITLTGIGLKFVGFVLAASGGHLFFALILAALACLILGTGLPTVPAYITVAAVAVPAIIDMGVPPLAAHMFAVYFASFAAITPPDASAAYAGAGIAGSDPWRTGWCATRLGVAAYIVPFMFVYGPALLLLDTPLAILWAFITALVGTYSLAAAVQGWLLTRAGFVERILLGISALLLIKTDPWGDLIGFLLLGGAFLSQRHKARQVHTAKARASVPLDYGG
jgi:TRAP transporter 4TM/12TM fusion protein